MTLRESLRGTVAALWARPELFVLGGAIGLVQAGLLGIWFSVLAPDVGGLSAVVAVLGSLFLVLPLFVGLYELTLRPAPAEPSVAALRRAVGTALRRYPAVLRTDAVVAAASVPVAVAAALGWFAAVTAGRYVHYLLGDPATPSVRVSFFLVVVAATLGAVLGSTLFRFGDCLAAFHECDAVTAVAGSAAAGRRHLASLAGFAAAVVAVHLGSFVVLAGLVAASSTDPSVPALGAVVAAVVLYGLAVTLTGVLHAVFYRDHVAPAVGSTSTDVALRQFVHGRSPARVVLAFVLVVGLVSGAAAVRALDPGIHSPPEQSPLATDDPDVAVRTAAERTAASNRRQVLHARNVSDPAGSFRILTRSGFDYTDRQRYAYFHHTDGVTNGAFYGEGTLALLRPNGDLTGALAYERGPWSVLAVPIWGTARGGMPAETFVVPNDHVDGWRVVDANESAMVVRTSDPEGIGAALRSRGFRGTTRPLANESHLTVVIDRERGVLEGARFHLHSLETGRNFRYRMEYREVGTADVKRPEPIRDRWFVEALWDALYY